MKRNCSRLLMLVAAITVCAGAMLANTGQDVFDKSNQAKIDPFSEAYKAGPIQHTVEKKQTPAEVPDSLYPKDAPPDPTSVLDVIDFEVTVTPVEVKRGQTVHVTVTGLPRIHWHTYAMNLSTQHQTTSTFVLGATPGLRPLGPIQESPNPVPDIDKTGAGTWQHKGKFKWEFDLLVQPDSKAVGPVDFPFSVDLQVCDKSCLNGLYPLKAAFVIQQGDAVAVPADVAARASQAFPPAAKAKIPVGSTEAANAPKTAANNVGLPRDYKASMEKVLNQFLPYVPPDQDTDLLSFILTGMFWGFVSLITPCVFPMIPITVSFFLKQSEKEHHKPVTMALVYCGTIVVVLTIAAAALLSFFKALSISPWMNFALGALFIVFALSLFGMYDIELPSFLARYTSEREGRGGMVGTIFMALTFTIISFACVAPFLGGFGGTAATNASRPWWHAIVGGLAFSITFAAPFFALALFPTLLRALPKSGSWLNSVKVVMGFLELAAALKFLRAGELVWSSTPSIFTFDLVLGLWIAICLLCGLYLLGAYRLPHDSPAEHLTVPRLVFSFLFIGLGFYLMPALFSPQVEDAPPRPNGGVFAWVYSFLLPDTRPQKGEAWTGNLENAVAESREYRREKGVPKLIFVDVTGKTCTNCRINENSVFSKSEFKKLFQPYLLVQLYTDIVPIEFYSPDDRAELAANPARQTRDGKQVNLWFQEKAFNDIKLPLYAILEPLPDGKIKIHGVYGEGLINNEQAFAEFLRKPLQSAGTNVASR